MQQKMTAARMTAAPTTDPMTIPAIAPGLRPLPRFPAPAAVLVAVGLDELVDEGKSGGIDVVVGRCTF